MQGDLSEFSLSELLQLFSLSEKSGSITISNGEDQSRLFLEAGRIAGWGLDDFDVHAMFLACRSLPPATEASLRSISPDPNTPGLAFIIRNLIEPHRWSSFVQRILEQEVFGLLNLDEGSFEIAISRIPSVPLSLDMSAQQLILDGSRWEADCAKLAQEGYGPQSEWQRVEADGSGTQLGLSDRDRLVLSALSYSGQLCRIGAENCLPDLETATSIRFLHQHGLVAPGARVDE